MSISYLETCLSFVIAWFSSAFAQMSKRRLPRRLNGDGGRGMKICTGAAGNRKSGVTKLRAWLRGLLRLQNQRVAITHATRTPRRRVVQENLAEQQTASVEAKGSERPLLQAPDQLVRVSLQCAALPRKEGDVKHGAKKVKTV